MSEKNKLKVKLITVSGLSRDRNISCYRTTK